MQPIARGIARQAFARLAGLDPLGQDAHLTAADAAPCYQLTTPRGSVIYAAGATGRRFWIHAAVGTGRDLLAPLLAANEYQAHRAGCSCVGFQTLRRGLIRRADRLGYLVTDRAGAGFVLEKAIA